MSVRMMNDVVKPRAIETHCPLCGRSFARVGSSKEHIFPLWLQKHHTLLTRRLTIPNFLGKKYKSIKIRICIKCNNDRFGKLETKISPLMRHADAYAALAAVSDRELAVWLGKIFWLLCRKSNSVEDYRTRNDEQKDQILPNELFAGILYLGMMQRCHAMRKGMYGCYNGDPPIPEYFYGEPYSLYRFRIDTRDTRFEAFDFTDNIVTLSATIRSGTFGMICLFDGGLHRYWRSRYYGYLRNEALHPLQFAEVAGMMVHDQMVLDDSASRVKYFWNRPLKSVVAMCETSRRYEPYLEENFDPERFAEILGRHTFTDPKMFRENAEGLRMTRLKDLDGNFLRMAVTEEEMESARKKPGFLGFGPLDVSLRQKP